MRILHYSLGLPPFRSGGLTKYTVDLITKEAKTDNEIFLLYPGSYTIDRKCRIRSDKTFKSVKVYEILNPLPVPLMNGISNPKIFYEHRDRDVFYNWLYKMNIDLIHIHTFMGLPIEFMEVVRELGIKILYTTHDYYGLCPKVNLVRNDGSICSDNKEYRVCQSCSKDAFSNKKIIIMQSKPYRLVKGMKFSKKIFSLLKKNQISCKDAHGKMLDDERNNVASQDEISNYEFLNNYYKRMFRMIDYFHFNSSVAKRIYIKLLGDIEGEVISISHGDIRDNRIEKSFNGGKLNILFLGNELEYKGLPMLIEALKSIDSKYSDKWQLDIYGTNIIANDENIIYNGKYNYKELPNIFNSSDVIIVPSIWYETFGFVALEAYSYGLPIILTDLVGFKDIIINNKNGLIVDANKESLLKKITLLIENRENLSLINKEICSSEFTLTIENHTNQIISLYNKLLGGV